MSGDFGEFKEVKTRKVHRCISCNRDIPIGSQAHHQGGMWEGDWQDWYMCLPCDLNDVCEPSEGIIGCEFDEWANEQPFSRCPRCEELQGNPVRYNTEMKWSDDEKYIEFKCLDCGHKFAQFIGFGGEDFDPFWEVEER